MKRFPFALLATVYLSGCYFSPGERTVFWDSDGTVTIERYGLNNGSSDEGEWQTAACIALPDSWTNPVSVNVSGTAQIDNVSTAFTAIGANYADGAAEISGFYSIEGYSWQCVSDIARQFAEGDVGEVQWSFTPEADNTLVYTSFGAISDDIGNEQFFDHLVSHQLLSSKKQTQYWDTDTEDLAEIDGSVGYLQKAEIDEEVLLFSWLHSDDFRESSTQLFRATEAGFTALADIPATDRLIRVNGIYISFQDYIATIDDDNQKWTLLRSSSDLVNWTDGVVLPHLSTVQWDAVNEEYVAIINDYHTPIAYGVYTSSDLLEWTLQDWVNSQRPTVAFLGDGSALLDTGNWSAPYRFRDKDTGEWSEVDIVPPLITDKTVGFIVSNLTVSHGKYRTHGAYRLSEEGAPASNGDVIYGQSSDGKIWEWNTIGAYSDVGTGIDMDFISDDEIFYQPYNGLYHSLDAGKTWNKVSAPLLDYLDETATDLISTLNIVEVNKKDGTYYLWVQSQQGGQVVFNALVSSQNLENYSFLTMAGYSSLLPDFDHLAFLEDTQAGQRIVHLRDAEIETSKSKNKSGAFGWWMLLMVAGLFLRRVK